MSVRRVQLRGDAATAPTFGPADVKDSLWEGGQVVAKCRVCRRTLPGCLARRSPPSADPPGHRLRRTFEPNRDDSPRGVYRPVPAVVLSGAQTCHGEISMTGKPDSLRRF